MICSRILVDLCDKYSGVIDYDISSGYQQVDQKVALLRFIYVYVYAFMFLQLLDTAVRCLQPPCLIIIKRACSKSNNFSIHLSAVK